MKKTIIYIILLTILVPTAFSQTVFINELHYDDDGADTGEGVEIAGPTGTNLTGWTLEFYRDNGTVYDTESLSGIIIDQCDGGTLWFPVAGIQNGPADGLALIDGSNNIIQLLSYEGTFIGAVGTTAAGMTSTDIGVSESTPPPDGQSLQLTGTGTTYGEFTWAGPILGTPGACNSGQALPVELAYFTASNSINGTLLDWRTESEIENLGFLIERKTYNSDWSEIVSYKQDDTLLGQGTASYATDYSYTDNLVQQGITYEYRLADVDYNGVITYHSTREVTVDTTPLPSAVVNFTTIAFPNPFNPITTIQYSVPQELAIVTVDIYDIMGNLVKTLVNSEQFTGWYNIQWNGTNQFGNRVPGGIYLSRVVVGNEVKTNKLILLK